MGRLWGGPPTDIVEEGTRSRPHALVYGPSVIPVIERALIVFSLLVVSISSHRPRLGRRACVASVLLAFGVMLTFPPAGQSRHFLCCVLLTQGGNEERGLLAVCSLVMAISTIISYSERVRTFIGFARWSHFFDPLPLARLPSCQDFFPPHPHSIHSPWHSSHRFC